MSLSILLLHHLTDSTQVIQRFLVWDFVDLDPSLRLKPDDYWAQFLPLTNMDNLSFAHLLSYVMHTVVF